MFFFSFRETESPVLAQPGPCNVDVREASTLTQQQFLNEYVPFKPQAFGYIYKSVWLKNNFLVSQRKQMFVGNQKKHRSQ